MFQALTSMNFCQKTVSGEKVGGTVISPVSTLPPAALSIFPVGEMGGPSIGLQGSCWGGHLGALHSTHLTIAHTSPVCPTLSRRLPLESTVLVETHRPELRGIPLQVLRDM